MKEYLLAFSKSLIAVAIILLLWFLFEGGLRFIVSGVQAILQKDFLGFPNLGLDPADGDEATRVGAWLIPIGTLSVTASVLAGFRCLRWLRTRQTEDAIALD